MESHRRHILKAVSAFLEHNGESPATFQVIIKIPGSTLRLEPREDELGIHELPEAQQLILDQFLPGQVLSTAQISKLTGYKANSKLRGHLSELVKRGYLAVSPDGYQRVTGGGDNNGKSTVTTVTSPGDNDSE